MKQVDVVRMASLYAMGKSKPQRTLSKPCIFCILFKRNNAHSGNNLANFVDFFQSSPFSCKPLKSYCHQNSDELVIKDVAYKLESLSIAEGDPKEVNAPVFSFFFLFLLIGIKRQKVCPYIAINSASSREKESWTLLFSLMLLQRSQILIGITLLGESHKILVVLLFLTNLWFSSLMVFLFLF